MEIIGETGMDTQTETITVTGLGIRIRLGFAIGLHFGLFLAYTLLIIIN